MANLYPKITKDITALANKFNDMSIYPVNAQDYKDLFFIVRQLGLDVSSLTPSSTTPTLDQVTTAGNTTANTIDVGGVTTDYVQLDTLATPTPAQGMIYWDQDEETAGLQVNGLNYEIGQGLYWVGKNQTGSQINKGTAVYASGTLGASARILIAPMIADGSIDAKYFLGITAENIADGDDGKVITQGKIRQINTTGYGAAGNVLWVSPTTAGALTQTQPTGTDLALAVAFVLDFASNGTMAVRVSTLDENAFTAIPTLDQVTTAGNTVSNNGITITKASGTTLTLNPGASDNAILINNNGYIKWGSYSYMRGYSTTFAVLDSSYATKFSLNWGGNASYINTGGNVLIGTTTDNGYKLQVNGDATINGVRVGLGGGSVGTNTVVGYEAGLSNTTGTGIIAIGYQALNASTIGVGLVAVGYNALKANTTANYNTALGHRTLQSNTTSNNNTAVGGLALQANTASNNTAVGHEALYSNTTGAYNVSIGQSASRLNTTGYQNTSVGHAALQSNTTGNNNVAVGLYSLLNNTVSNNVAVGFESARYNTTGSVTVLGYQAGRNNQTGTEITAVGYQALYNSLGPANTAVGHGAGLLTNTGYSNTFIGASSGVLNTTGFHNTVIGNGALYSNSTGSYNTALGSQSLSQNTGSNNTSVGYNSLFSNTASNNTAVGYASSYSNTTGDSNVSVGYNSLYANSIGSRNSAFGFESLRYSTDASNNTAFGYQSLRTTTSGGSNTALGRQAGYFNSTGSGNVFLGHQAGFNETGSDKLYIGNSSTNTLIYGDFSTGNVIIGSTVDAGYKLVVNGSIATNTGFFAGVGQNTASNVLYSKTAYFTGGGNGLIMSTYYNSVQMWKVDFQDSSTRANTAFTTYMPNQNYTGSTIRITGQENGYFTQTLGQVTWERSKGSSAQAAYIKVANDATPSATSQSSYMAFGTTPSGSILSSERMRITSDGNVGIGTTAPESPLHIKYSSSTLPGITIENDGVGFNAGSMTLRSGTTGGTNMSVTAGGGMYWYNLDTSSNTLSLPSTGNLIVGGAVDAGFRLDVQGGDARFAQNVEAATYSVAGNAGYSGIVNFPSNPAGSQNLEFLHGILINVF